MTVSTWQHIAAVIGDFTEEPFRPRKVSDVGGGCINRTVCLGDGRRRYLVKLNESSRVEMFQAEREGLEALSVPGAPRVPATVAHGTIGDLAYLALEFVPMSGLSGHAWASLGERLAVLHRTTASGFGWHRDNTIGATPQVNEQRDDWLGFWRENRLGYQLKLAEDNGLDASVARAGWRLYDRLEVFFDDHSPPPSLLHGDLWGGNVAADEDGTPVLFDPAVYFGDRETDLAMTELFGRFDRRFYQAYQDSFPLEPGYPERRPLYNLYHVLNHFNLFGAGYAGQAGSLIGRLLKAGG